MSDFSTADAFSIPVVSFPFAVDAREPSGSGSGLDIPAMMDLQIQMSAFSLIGQLISAAIKDVTDTMKSSVRNIN